MPWAISAACLILLLSWLVLISLCCWLGSWKLVLASGKIFKYQTWERNLKALSLDKKWCDNHIAPYMHTPSSLFQKSNQSRYAKIVPMEHTTISTIFCVGREYRLVKPEFVWGTGYICHTPNWLHSLNSHNQNSKAVQEH